MSNLQRVDRLLSVKDIKANPRNARTHSKAQIGQISDSIKACGFGAPVLVDETLTLIAGHGRFKAAEFLGMQEIPAVQLLGLSQAQKRALALADNKIAELGSWDPDQLKETLALLVDPSLELSFNLDITGFDTKEIHTILHPAAPRRPDPRGGLGEEAGARRAADPRHRPARPQPVAVV